MLEANRKLLTTCNKMQYKLLYMLFYFYIYVTYELLLIATIYDFFLFNIFMIHISYNNMIITLYVYEYNNMLFSTCCTSK
jgi:hypothetical protein